MSKSEQLYQRASQSIAGGVNSPVRAFRAVGGTPIFFSKAKGPISMMLMASGISTILAVGGQ